MNWPYKYFKPAEVLSPEGIYLLEQDKQIMIQSFAMDLLEKFRELLDVEILVNFAGLKLRGYRTEHENYMTDGSAKYSRHVQGIAFDMSSFEVPLEKIYQLAIEFDGWNAIGYYPKKHFIHVDCRTLIDDKKILWRVD